jgi:hypothetical protein
MTCMWKTRRLITWTTWHMQRRCIPCQGSPTNTHSSPTFFPFNLATTTTTTTTTTRSSSQSTDHRCTSVQRQHASSSSPSTIVQRTKAHLPARSRQPRCAANGLRSTLSQPYLLRGRLSGPQRPAWPSFYASATKQHCPTHHDHLRI